MIGAAMDLTGMQRDARSAFFAKGKEKRTEFKMSHDSPQPLSRVRTLYPQPLIQRKG